METTYKKNRPCPRNSENVKIDIWDAAVESVFGYGFSLLHISANGVWKLQQFDNKSPNQTTCQNTRDTINDDNEVLIFENAETSTYDDDEMRKPYIRNFALGGYGDIQMGSRSPARLSEHRKRLRRGTQNTRNQMDKNR